MRLQVDLDDLVLAEQLARIRPWLRSVERTIWRRRDRDQAQPELVQPVVVDAEVMGHLVDHRHSDLLDDLGLARGHAADRQPVDRDAIRHRQRAGGVSVHVVAARERHALVEPEQVAGARVVLDEDGHVVHEAPEALGDAVERLGDELFEALRLDLDHGGPRYRLAIRPGWPAGAGVAGGAGRRRRLAGGGGPRPRRCHTAAVDMAALLEGLDADQREAVQTDAAPLVILAPAGSGKTRVLTLRIARRVADGSADADHVLAITFTRRAAGELQRRLGALGLRARPTAGTFHGVAWAVLAQRWTDEQRPDPSCSSTSSGCSARCSTTSRARGRRPHRPAGGGGHRDRLGAGPPGAAASLRRTKPPRRAPDRAPRRCARRADDAPTQDTKRRRRLVDFDDLLDQCAQELRHDPAFAAAQRWRFRHLFVDEFQDVNPLQFRLLEAWRGGRPDLCVVGDPNQAIYGWNGADPTLLSRFPELVGGATVVRLVTTYRSTPQVVATAGVCSCAGDQPRPVRADGPPPQVHAFATDADEAVGIARLVADPSARAALVVVRGARAHPRAAARDRARRWRRPASRHGSGPTGRC